MFWHLRFIVLPAALLVVGVGEARAGELYHVRRLSEWEMLQTYTSMLREACRHADQFWKSSDVTPGAGYWGNGLSDGNEGIRAIGEMVLTCGGRAGRATHRVALYGGDASENRGVVQILHHPGPTGTRSAAL